MYDQISLLYDVEQQQKAQLDIIKRKNSDYASVNPFENFQVTAHFANMDTTSTFAFHLANKLTRIKNLLTKDPDVVEESIEDSINDMANYCQLMLAYIRHEKRTHRKDNTEDTAASGKRGNGR
jgi:hypothetical protein